MAKYLKIFNLDGTEEIRKLAEGEYLPYAQHLITVVEDQAVSSYEELVQVADQDMHRGKEVLEVRFLEILTGG